MSETLDPAQSLSHTKAFVSGLAINLTTAVTDAVQKAGSDEETILAEAKAAFKAALAKFEPRKEEIPAPVATYRVEKPVVKKPAAKVAAKK
jgi:hypothetical protein